MNKNRDTLLLGLSVAGVVFGMGGSPYAYAAAADVAVEEVVVTAQRRTERLQDVPISVTAISGAALERSGITSTADLSMVTPGLVWTQALSNATPLIRGVGTSDGSAGNESSNAFYVDGFYYPSMPGALFSLSNIERVEVLKGPQGTLFGRNATGGLIQLVTRDPSSEPHLDARVGYGNYDTFETSLYATAGLGKSVAGDISLYWNNQNQGWGQTLRNIDINKAKTFAWRSKVKVDLGKASFTVAGDYAEREGDIGTTRNFLPGAMSLGNVRGFSGTIYDSGDHPTPWDYTRQGGISLKGETDLGFARFVSLSSYREVKARIPIDQDQTLVDQQAFDITTHDRSFTQELQLLSPAGSKIDWIVGSFYMGRRIGYDPSILYGTSLAAVGGGVVQYVTAGASSLAAYGQATATVLERTRLTLGLRYTSDEQHIWGYRRFYNGFITVFPAKRAQFSKISWRLALDHKITDNILAYFSVTRGFKSGLFNLTSPLDPAVSPEILDAYEVGLKSMLIDRRLQLNIAAYRYNYTGIQLQRLVGPNTQTYNASSAVLNGIDVEAKLRIAEGLSLQSGLTYLPEAKYGTFLNAPISSRLSTGGNFVQTGDASGHRMIRAPQVTFNFGLNYQFNLGSGRVDSNINLSQTSSFSWDPDNRVRQSPYTLLNGQLGWSSANGSYGITLWARNMTGSQYYVFVNTSIFGDQGAPGAPRTFGVTLKSHF